MELQKVAAPSGAAHSVAPQPQPNAEVGRHDEALKEMQKEVDLVLNKERYNYTFMRSKDNLEKRKKDLEAMRNDKTEMEYPGDVKPFKPPQCEGGLDEG